MNEMENESSQTATESGSDATRATSASKAVEMVKAIPETLLTAMEAAIQTNIFNTDPAGYAEVMRGIISKRLVRKNMSNKMKSQEI